jgi:hypothetical protein
MNLIIITVFLINSFLIPQHQNLYIVELDITNVATPIQFNGINLDKYTSGVISSDDLRDFGKYNKKSEKKTPISSHILLDYDGYSIELSNYSGNYELTDLIINSSSNSLSIAGIDFVTGKTLSELALDFQSFAQTYGILPEFGVLPVEEKRTSNENKATIRAIYDPETEMITEILYLCSPI